MGLTFSIIPILSFSKRLIYYYKNILVYKYTMNFFGSDFEWQQLLG